MPERPAPPRRWYHSLYWRIALGFILCVALLLVAQGLLVVWLAGRANASQASRSPVHLANAVASNLADALEEDANADLGKLVRDEFGRSPYRLFVLLRDGTVVRNREFTEPEFLQRAARARLRRESFPPRADRDGESPEGRGAAPPSGESRRTFRRSPAPIGPIVVSGETVGVVVVVPGPTPGALLLAEIGPTLAVAGVSLLLVGTLTMAFFVFRPARRRLAALEDAAQSLGAGGTGVRAPEQGGDEVASLARSFNQMASDLEARVRDLQEADRARRQLLADVSHELMTPLTAMRGYLETLALPEAVPNAEARERYVRIVHEETLRLESIIGDLLELARLEGGGAELHRSSAPTAVLFARAAERHAQALADKSIALETSIEPGAETVDGDARRLEQAVQNLVANAVRHTPAGGRIGLTAAAAEPGWVTLRVEDSGPGIAPEHLPHVFDRFYRADAARDAASGGSGLGLSIVRAIVERHGGRVAVASPPGNGARFELTLPVGRGLVADEPATAVGAVAERLA